MPQASLQKFMKKLINNIYIASQKKQINKKLKKLKRFVKKY